MHRAHWLTRWTVHVAVFALLLKAAVPMLASAAAHAQGKSVAQVCDVYGVALTTQRQHAGHDQHSHAGAHAAQHEHAPGHGNPDAGSGHGGGHCALTALAALTPPDAPEAIWARVPVAFLSATAAPGESPPDASARWAARLKHGPPAVV